MWLDQVGTSAVSNLDSCDQSENGGGIHYNYQGVVVNPGLGNVDDINKEPSQIIYPYLKEHFDFTICSRILCNEKFKADCDTVMAKVGGIPVTVHSAKAVPTSSEPQEDSSSSTTLSWGAAANF